MPLKRPMLWRVFFLSLVALLGGGVRAAEGLPAAPRGYLTDYAGLLTPAMALALDAELVKFERATSSQFIVVIYPSLPPGASLDEYTTRLFQSWDIGRRERKNGAVLFVFSEDQKARVVTGAGLTDGLPDALARQIVENELQPRIRTDYGRGIEAAVHALLKAARGDDRGNVKAAVRRDEEDANDFGVGGFGLIIFGVVVLSMLREVVRRNFVYSRDGRRAVWNNPFAAGGQGGRDDGNFSGGGTGGNW